MSRRSRKKRDDPLCRMAALPTALIVLLAPMSCSDDPTAGIPGTQVLMSFDRAGGFYSAPFPSLDLQDERGRLDMDGFPNPYAVPFVNDTLALGEADTDGASINGGVFFTTSAPLDANSLPDVHETVTAACPVALIDVSPESPDYLERHPVTIDFQTDGGPHGAQNLLSLLPVQGLPLRPATRYAAVILRELGDAEGRALGVSPEMAALVRGERPSVMSESVFDAYHDAISALEAAAMEAGDLAGLAVFDTADPVAPFAAAVAYAAAHHQPEFESSFELREVFDDFCTYHATIDMPVYQEGEPPFATSGGRWAMDDGGLPQLQGYETANFWITVPRREIADTGLPVVVFIRTGGGGDRPLIDRGARSEAGGEADVPGEGPARYFARAGFAGVSVDGPHGGLRNVTDGDEQFLMFNIINPAALRDNIRQSALEIALLADVLAGITIDASECPDVSGSTVDTVGFDMEHLAPMGHSMGATIAPLVLTVEPRFGAVILSGAGGSWIENIIHKQSPLVVRPMAELMLGYSGRELHTHDPIVSMVQWAADSADPLSYLRYIVQEPNIGAPRHILMFQGIVDTYILPPIANAYSLGFGIDLAGPALDEGHPELSEHLPLTELLPLSGGEHVDLPALGNIGHDSQVTAVVVQHLEDGIEDGHEVVFQTPLPKEQYECFLRTSLSGVPFVPGDTVDPFCE